MLSSSDDHIAYAASLLAAGALVAFPTETVYGLGADARDSDAVRHIFEVKNRPMDNPLIVHVPHVSLIHTVAADIPPRAKLLYQFWPGPLTVVFRAKKHISSLVTAGTGKVAVRIPAHPVAQRLLKKAQIPVAAPSANMSGRASSTTAQHVHTDFFHSPLVSAIVDGGSCDVGIESTVVDITQSTVTILRPGVITQTMLEEALLERVVMASSHVAAPIAPGMKYSHYKPNATVGLVTEEQALACATQEKTWILSCIAHQDFSVHHVLTSQNLYALFRRADDEGVDRILIVQTPQLSKQAGLLNRIEKASGTM